MNKSALVDLIAQKRNIPRKHAEDVVELVFQMITDALRAGDRVEVRGFGSFVVRHYEARVGRNPRNGQPLQVPKKPRPFFKAGKELKQRVDTLKGKLPADSSDDGDEA